MENRSFCFLNDQYFVDFPDSHLMRNHENLNGSLHHRPCFFAFQDTQEPEIYWLVPVSKQAEKYRVHANKKIAKWGYCNSLVFGNVAGSDAAFLIQNMCPATDKYISSIYYDKNHNPIQIDNRLAETVIHNAKKTLIDCFRGKPVIFPDVRSIKSALVKQIEVERAHSPQKQSVMDKLEAAKAKCAEQNQLTSELTSPTHKPPTR